MSSKIVQKIFFEYSINIPINNYKGWAVSYKEEIEIDSISGSVSGVRK
jgi:hypothetical protein